MYFRYFPYSALHGGEKKSTDLRKCYRGFKFKYCILFYLEVTQKNVYLERMMLLYLFCSAKIVYKTLRIYLPVFFFFFFPTILVVRTPKSFQKHGLLGQIPKWPTNSVESFFFRAVKCLQDMQNCLSSLLFYFYPVSKC